MKNKTENKLRGVKAFSRILTLPCVLSAGDVKQCHYPFPPFPVLQLSKSSSHIQKLTTTNSSSLRALAVLFPFSHSYSHFFPHPLPSPTHTTVAMSLFQCALAVAAACLVSGVSADKEEFPLVWVCLGITIVGVIVALYVAYRRPDELHLPGSTVMTAQETEGAEEGLDGYDNARKGYENSV